MKKSPLLKQSLILSVTLNVALVALFSYFFLRDPFALDFKPAPTKRSSRPFSHTALLSKSQDELIQLLDEKRVLEEGCRVRDAALAALAHTHHIDVERALAGRLYQKRLYPLENDEMLTLYTQLDDVAYQKIKNFLSSEKWPLTPHGLFQHLFTDDDPELWHAFMRTPHFQLVESLFATNAPSKAKLLQLVVDGGWERLETFYLSQKQACDLSKDTRIHFLSDYLEAGSEVAAELLDLKEPMLEIVEQEEAPTHLEHLIAPGESLWVIARKYGVTIDAIVDLNSLNSNTIRPGKTLRIPVTASQERGIL